jgi:hypothetical protein
MTGFDSWHPATQCVCIISVCLLLGYAAHQWFKALREM